MILKLILSILFYVSKTLEWLFYLFCLISEFSVLKMSKPEKSQNDDPQGPSNLKFK